MRLKDLLFLAFLLSILSINNAGATSYTSNTNGDWTNPTVWTPNGIPGTGDDVTIYDSIYVNSPITISNIIINNFEGRPAILYINNNDTLKVLGNVIATADNVAFDVKISVKSTSVFYVLGNTTYEREVNNNRSNLLGLYLYDDSKTFILGDFNFTYEKSHALENNYEVYLEGNAQLDISGKTIITTWNGKYFDFMMEGNSQAFLRDSLKISLSNTLRAGITSNGNSHFQLLNNAYIKNINGLEGAFLKTGTSGGKITITNNITLESETIGMKSTLETNGANGQINIGGNIIMTATGAGSAGVNLVGNSELKFGGDLIRTNPFGYLNMDPSSVFTFNGNSQTFPDDNLAGSGTDSLNFRKIFIEVSPDGPISLTKDLVIEDTLFLTKGNIVTSPSAQLVLEDNAVISGGSNTAYVEGPILKKGRTNGIEMTLPIGTDTRYAPVTVSPIGDAASEVTVRYYSDPPPFGNTTNLEAGIDNISTQGYWNITKNASTGDLDITLHWENAAEIGITNLDDLIVVGSDPTAETWINYGQESTTGRLDTAGSITSLYSDPPPFGVINFTFGSTSALNMLPVELTKFAAIQIDKQVGLSWQTASEVNSSHFIIERSADGFNFERIGSVDAQGNSTIGYNYFFRDKNPYQGLNYYRLKIVDNDLSFEYSFIEVVKFDKDASLIIYPNPVDKMLNIQGNNTFHGDTQLEVFDRSGQQVFSGMVDFNNGKFQIPVDKINVSSAGTYFIKVTKDAENYVLKLLKIE